MTKIQQIINDYIEQQIKKGYRTYGKTLDECSDDAYDWTSMALEESVDLNQYLVKEVQAWKRKYKRLETENRYLRMGRSGSTESGRQ